MADTQTGGLPKLGERLSRAADERGSATLTCQWCSVTLPPGETICSTCGSPGIPDTSMVVPSIVEPLKGNAVEVQLKGDEELVEWWKEDEEVSAYKNTASEDHNPLPVILGLIGTAIVCVLLGVLIAPTLLASAFESSLSITVEDNNDLRPLGGVLGLIVAAFIGAIGMWIAAPRR